MTIGHREATHIGSVVSVNVGMPRDIEWAGRTVRTAIWKEPTDQRVPVEHDNLAGDQQADLRVHGGPDKAVYAYSAEDYRWWEERLGAPLDPGTFGENLTTVGLELDHAVIGEVWAIGTALLQVAQTRQPCFKLGIRMGDAGFVEEFDRARRFGVYLRIMDAGDVGVGDGISLVSATDPRYDGGEFRRRPGLARHNGHPASPRDRRGARRDQGVGQAPDRSRRVLTQVRAGWSNPLLAAERVHPRTLGSATGHRPRFGMLSPPLRGLRAGLTKSAALWPGGFTG